MFRGVLCLLVWLIGLFMLAAFIGTYVGMTLATRLWG